MNYALLGLIVLTAVVVVWNGSPAKPWGKEIYYFIGFCLLLFCVIFGITILNWEIVGSGISVRQAKEEVVKAREEVLATKADIIFISSRTIELNDLVLDCTGRFGGCGEAQLSRIKEKRKELIKHLEALRENK